MRSRSLMLLTLICLLLVVGLAWLWLTPQGRLREEVHWTEPAALRIDYAAMLPPLPGSGYTDAQRFLVLLERPLFSLARRPPLPTPPPKQAETAPPPDNLSSARVQAIFEVPGDGGGVILLIAGKSQRVRVNGKVEGWTVRSIDGYNVTFERRDQTRVLQLQRAALTTYTGLAAPSAGQSATAATPNAAPAPSGAAERRSARAASAPPAPDAAPRARAVFGGSR